MITSTTRHLQIIVILHCLVLCAFAPLHTRASDSLFANPFAWASHCLHSFKVGLAKPRTEISPQLLAFKAAQLNATITNALTFEEKVILLKNLYAFKELASNAQKYPEAHRIMEALIAPEQKHPDCANAGVDLYTNNFAPHEDKPFLSSEQGKNTLHLVLGNAPYKKQTLTVREQLLHKHALKNHIETKVSPLIANLEHIKKELQQAESDPSIDIINNDTILAGYQEKIELIKKQLIDKEAQLADIMPLLEQKSKEVEGKLQRIVTNPSLTYAQKEQAAQHVTHALNDFLSQYPAIKETADLEKQHNDLVVAAQKHVQQLVKDHPVLATVAQLTQNHDVLAQEINRWIESYQNIDQALDHPNKIVWSKNAEAWFASCIKALEDNAQPEHHILFDELKHKQRDHEWHTLIQGWKDLDTYLYYKVLNVENAEKYSGYIKKQYERLEKTTDDLVNEAHEGIADLLKLPKDVKQSLECLDITDIDPKDLNQEHANRIKAGFKKQSLLWHPDKNPHNKQEAEARQKNISEAYSQLKSLIAQEEPVLTDEQKELYDVYKDVLKQPEPYLEREHKQAKRELAFIEEGLKHEEIALRHLEENVLFNNIYSHAISQAKREAFTLLKQTESVATQINPITSIIVRNRD